MTIANWCVLIAALLPLACRGRAGIRPVFLYKPARNKGIAQEA